MLLGLLVAAAAFVLGYVIHRKAQMRAAPPAPARVVGPLAAPATPEPAPPVHLGGPNEAKTIDFSSGRAEVKNTPEDRAALDAGLKDIADAIQDVTFEAPKKANPPPQPPGQP